MLITTLPSVTRMAAVHQMVNHLLVGGVRYNIGMRTPYPPEETLSRLLEVVDQTGKRFWIDLKGRQLRITQWADPTYGDIVLNHAILSLDLPATIVFRGGGSCQVVAFRGNRIFVEPDPPGALGAGQAVNIIGENLVIGGFLTEQDVEFIEAGVSLGIHDVMVSFVEHPWDPDVVWAVNPEARQVFKLESRAGLAFAKEFDSNAYPDCHLMVARDDLMTNIGPNKIEILHALELIIKKDPEAIAASHLLGSLEHGCLSAADISDLALLHSLGYRNFLLGDRVSHHHFDEAMRVWGDFLRYWKVIPGPGR